MCSSPRKSTTDGITVKNEETPRGAAIDKGHFGNIVSVNWDKTFLTSDSRSIKFVMKVLDRQNGEMSTTEENVIAIIIMAADQLNFAGK